MYPLFLLLYSIYSYSQPVQTLYSWTGFDSFSPVTGREIVPRSSLSPSVRGKMPRSYSRVIMRSRIRKKICTSTYVNLTQQVGPIPVSCLGEQMKQPRVSTNTVTAVPNPTDWPTCTHRAASRVRRHESAWIILRKNNLGSGFHFVRPLKLRQACRTTLVSRQSPRNCRRLVVSRALLPSCRSPPAVLRRFALAPLRPLLPPRQLLRPSPTCPRTGIWLRQAGGWHQPRRLGYEGGGMGSGGGGGARGATYCSTQPAPACWRRCAWWWPRSRTASSGAPSRRATARCRRRRSASCARCATPSTRAAPSLSCRRRRGRRAPAAPLAASLKY